MKEYQDKAGRPYVQVMVRITGHEAIDLLQAIRFADTGRIRPSAHNGTVLGVSSPRAVALPPGMVRM